MEVKSVTKLILMLSIAGKHYTAADEVCDPSTGEVWNECGSFCTRTCGHDKLCIDGCNPRCECPPENPVMHDGRCIKASECVTCDPSTGEVFTECGNHCTLTCGGVLPQCLDICIAMCVCPSEKPWRKNGVCITTEECQTCNSSIGEVWNDCGSACTRTCRYPKSASCSKQCVPKCECPAEKPLLEEGKCVAIEECGTCDSSTGEVWNACGSDCTPTCQDPKPVCNEQCVPKCECPAEKPVMEEGKCVALEECGSCNKRRGEFWNPCGSNCTRTCDDPEPVCSKQCVARCECSAEKPYRKGNKCVQPEKCCNKNKGFVWNKCGKDSTPTCNDPNPGWSGKCVPRCECHPDRPYLKNNKCVTGPQCCKASRGLVWTDCGSCRPTCDNPVIGLCTADCKQHCECVHETPILKGNKCVRLDQC